MVENNDTPSGPFIESYPRTASWVQEYGWIELGYNDYSPSFIRALDSGGMVWEGKPRYRSLDDALSDLEQAIDRYLPAELER
jgi:hypothetical protein